MENLKELRQETLCGNNAHAKYLLMSLRKKLKKLGISNEDVYTFIQDSLDTLKIMRKQGQKLEDRLRAQRVMFEKLGYRRIKRGKIQDTLK